MVVMLGGFLMIGCGGLDEVGQRYVSRMVIEDNGTETLDIDVVRGDCDGEPEPFTNVFAIFTVSVAEDALGLTLQKYSIQYLPVYTPDGTGNVVLPPTLESPGDMIDNFDVASGATGTLQIVCMDIDTKEEYVNEWLSDPELVNLDISQYIIRITFFFKDQANKDVVFKIDRTVNLANFDNC